MNTNRSIGGLFVAGAIALFIPYTMLTIVFEYPDILRQDTASILTKFHAGGASLIWTWFAFAITGLPLLPAYIFLGQKLEGKAPLVRVATTKRRQGANTIIDLAKLAALAKLLLDPLPFFLLQSELRAEPRRLGVG